MLGRRFCWDRLVRGCASILFVVVGLSLCWTLGCSSRAKLGDGCKEDGECAAGLLCYQEQCLQEGNVKLMRTSESGGRTARKVGEKIDVEWRGSYKPATIVGVVGPGSYRVHFEGFDAQWDEVVGEGRIKRSR